MDRGVGAGAALVTGAGEGGEEEGDRDRDDQHCGDGARERKDTARGSIALTGIKRAG